jgi:sarcosine oxidase subunit alpha
MTSNRLPTQAEEWIDRSSTLSFRFEGREYEGFAGDTISTALWASGVRVLGRSFKYHRPRGIFSLSDQDANAMMESCDATNIRADLTLIEDQLDVRAVNTFGGVDRDFGKAVDMLSVFFPVGFYYKAFHTPRWLFPFYEKKMRQAAGLGTIKTAKTLTHSPKRYDFCDVLVVGAGAAGLSAAIAAAEHGLRVVLVEERPRPGGTLCFQSSSNPETRVLLQELREKASSLRNLDVRTSTVAAGYYADHWIALIDAKRLTKMRARSVVFATGCYEQPAVFRHNDLPGNMLASAAQRLIHQFAVRPFHKALLLVANAEGYQTALDLHAAGTEVQMIIDLRHQGESSELAAKVAEVGIPIQTGAAIYEAIPSRGKKGIRGAVVCQLSKDGQPFLKTNQQVECDGIAMSVGWAPADGLLRQAGARMVYSEALEQYIPAVLPPGLFAAGRVNGIYPRKGQFDDGIRAGDAAAAYCGAQVEAGLTQPPRIGSSPNHAFPIIPHPKGKNFVDLDEDIQLKDIENAVQEGFESIELLKRYSTFGMGPSQGKHTNLNVVRTLSRLKGETLAATGVTTARPFTSPVPLGHLAGKIFSPYRQTPLHECHVKAEAKLMFAGNWLRPEFYALPGQLRRDVIASEVNAVRQQVGLIDVSTLGKIEISGPDACNFMERIYTGRYAKLASGMTRYVLMCDETGVMIDDGVTARLAADRFYTTTTTSGSDSIFREMQRWRLSWGMDVVLTNVTSHVAAINLAGPDSKDVLARVTDVNLDFEAFPYLGVREGYVAGVKARLLRVGFVGELGYEIHMPADSAVWVWDQLIRAGKDFGIRPFGVEAQRILRLEKGHLIVGQDSDGLTNPFEAGMNWAVKLDKTFFVGQRSLSILKSKPLARSLGGFSFPRGYAGSVPSESNLIIDQGEIAGRVTSISYSPTLGQVIGMAYLRPGQERPETLFSIRLDDGSFVEASVTKTPFYDEGNTKQN